MKKLIVLTIFVLLFSITIIAGDLSKEEIISELEKITAIANGDNRLKGYDILSEKFRPLPACRAPRRHTYPHFGCPLT